MKIIAPRTLLQSMSGLLVVKEYVHVSVKASASVTYDFASKTTGHANLPAIRIVSVARIMTKRNWTTVAQPNRMVKQMKI
jgi:hypothetical protein